MTAEAGPKAAVDGPAAAWREWRTRRIESVSAPYGPLALVGTYWPAEHPDGRLPGVPGIWTAEENGVVLTAADGDGLTVDGRPFTGRVRLGADAGETAAARVAYGARRLVVLVREGHWGVRDFDPQAAGRRRFRGIGSGPYGARWSVPARFTPYGEHRTVRVRNADGRERGLGLDGELAFVLDGQPHTLRVTERDDGTLWAVFADAGSGVRGYRFRFMYAGAPGADGRTTVDFNRAVLPPCSFADAFLCPFPPPGNTLSAVIEAGERNLL